MAGTKLKNSTSTKGDYFDRLAPSHQKIEFAQEPSKTYTERVVFRGRTRAGLTQDQWNSLLDIMETYRHEKGYALARSDTLGSVRKHIRSTATSLSGARERLRYFEGDATPAGAFPRRLSDLVRMTDTWAQSEKRPGGDLTFSTLMESVEVLLDRLALLEEVTSGSDYRFALGTQGVLRTAITPWARMVTRLSDWWVDLTGTTKGIGGEDGPFLRMVDLVTATVGKDFTGRGAAFEKAVQNVLAAARY